MCLQYIYLYVLQDNILNDKSTTVVTRLQVNQSDYTDKVKW